MAIIMDVRRNSALRYFESVGALFKYFFKPGQRHQSYKNPQRQE